MNIDLEKDIVQSLSSLYPLQEFEEKAIQTILDALPSAEHGTNLAEVGTDCISRQAAIDAVNGLIDRFEQILRDIREANGDDSVCGMCEYDGAYIGQSGDWCNECPGFDKEDCFKLSDKCRKRWLKSVELPPAEVGTDCSEFPNNSDTISRLAAIDALGEKPLVWYDGEDEIAERNQWKRDIEAIEQLPPIQPKRGRWIKLDMHRGMADHKCSVCEQECYVPTCMGEPMYAYCPNCGAKMEVNHESN